MKHLLPLCLLSTSIAQAASDKPNILVILADDLGSESLSCYKVPGATTAKTPTLNKLAQQGILFNHSWAAPLSTPSRACMLTGKHGSRSGVITLGQEVLTEELLLHRQLKEKSGYATALIGKWHISDFPYYPIDYGIDHFVGIMKGGTRDYSARQLVVGTNVEGNANYITTELTNRALSWIKAQDQNKPWFCWVAYTAPHTPIHLPPAHLHSQKTLSGSSNDIERNPQPYYMAMIESLDSEIDRLIRSIPAEDRKKLVVIFMGDNGTERKQIRSPYDRMQGKGSLCQGGIRVPLIIAGYGVPRAGQREDALVCATDMFATVSELSGIKLPRYEDSYSFAPLLKKAAKSPRSYAFAEGNTRQRGYSNTLTDGRYKVIYPSDGAIEFYDLLADPYEKQALNTKKLSPHQQQAYDKLLATRSALMKDMQGK